jgi:hypothetical protein
LNSGEISLSYASGAVTGEAANAGGLVGWHSTPGTITQTYATGTVTGAANGNIGGLVGLNVSGGVTSSYWDTQTSGRMKSAGGTGVSTAQLRSGAARRLGLERLEHSPQGELPPIFGGSSRTEGRWWRASCTATMASRRLAAALPYPVS